MNQTKNQMPRSTFLTIWIFLFLPITFIGQSLTLSDAIDRAQKESLSAQYADLRLQVAYWQFRSFKATYLPAVNFSGNVVNYDRSIRSEFDFVNSRYDYFFQSNLTNTARFSMDQRITLTGGEVYVDTYLGRLENFGDGASLTFSSIPIRIGLRQPLFGFNEWKWEKQLEPLKYARSQKEFVAEQEEIAYRTVQYFFSLARAQLSLEIARYDYGNADTLLRIGRERAALGTLTQDDLLELQMARLEAESSLSQAELELGKAQDQFRIYLSMEEEAPTILLPESLPNLQVPPDEAWQQAIANNPDILAYKEQELEAAQQEERTHRESRFQAELNAGFGLNKRSESLGEAYQTPMNQLQNVSLAVNIPILDWGRRKGQYELARANREVAEAGASLARRDLEQEVRNLCSALNRSADMVARSKQAAEIAYRRFQITRERFLQGNIDLIKLKAAIQAQRGARQGYLGELQSYWEYFYQVRQLTLYDFVEKRRLQDNKLFKN